jgi:hypothetical protein
MSDLKYLKEAVLDSAGKWPGQKITIESLAWLIEQALKRKDRDQFVEVPADGR